MIEAMERKYPKSGRKQRPKFGSEEYIENMSKKSTEMWKNRSNDDKEIINNKIKI